MLSRLKQINIGNKTLSSITPEPADLRLQKLSIYEANWVKIGDQNYMLNR